MAFELTEDQLLEKFQMFDPEGEGQTDKPILKAKALLKHCGKDLSNSDVRMLFTSCEVDPNGPLEFSGFLSLCKRLENPLSAVEKIKVMFKTYDADESGFISRTELRQLLKDMGKDNPCQLDGFMAFVDADGDEKITMEELLKKYKPK